MSVSRPLVRLGQTAQVAARRARPVITHAPPLPAVDFQKMGSQAPGLSQTPNTFPRADAVVICWAEAEWAPLHHVFVAGQQTMPYTDAGNGTWAGWQKVTHGVPAGAPHGITFWGYQRLVTVGGHSVLLFKSNVHLTEGSQYLEQLIQLLIQDVRPSLIMSTGTAGGARLGDPIGTINVIGAGTMYEKSGAQSTWPKYANAWQPAWSIVSSSGFHDQLFAVPTTPADLQSLAKQFNAAHNSSYTLADLDPDQLNMGAKVPAVNDLTPSGSLLTATSFVVADTSGNYDHFACVEMDDAVIGKVCSQSKVPFGFVRNISDPAQNKALPAASQGDWGSFVYEAYGFYTSYNGALAAWAILAGGLR
jgi:nucleoside phosphorylase